MDYALIKLIHQSAIVLSLLGFFARGLGMAVDAQWVRKRPARTLPHLIDTVLLLSGVALAWSLRLSPLAAPWLMAKLIGLVVYVVLGTIALRRGRTKAQRMVTFVAALTTFAYIVSVALSKDPRGFFAGMLG